MSGCMGKIFRFETIITAVLATLLCLGEIRADTGGGAAGTAHREVPNARDAAKAEQTIKNSGSSMKGSTSAPPPLSGA